jgi:L-lactate dehydrogenase
LDLQHASALAPGRIDVRHGDLAATENSQIVVLSLSAPLPPGDSHDRLVLAEPNARLFQTVVPQIAQYSPEAILLVVSNPVDVLTYATLQFSRFDASRVFGTGTLIDSARFRSHLSSLYGIHSDDIRAYILGEHGESQFPVLSTATAGGWSMGDDPAMIRTLTVRSKRQFALGRKSCRRKVTLVLRSPVQPP